MGLSAESEVSVIGCPRVELAMSDLNVSPCLGERNIVIVTYFRQLVVTVPTRPVMPPETQDRYLRKLWVSVIRHGHRPTR